MNKARNYQSGIIPSSTLASVPYTSAQRENIIQPYANAARALVEEHLSNTVQLKYWASARDLAALHSIFPEKHFSIDPRNIKSGCEHPVLRFINEYFNTKLRSYAKTAKKSGLNTLSIGGNGEDAKVYDHVCQKLEDISGFHRSHKNAHTSRPIISGHKHFCTGGTTNCLFNATIGYGVDSFYDIPFEEIQIIFEQHQLNELFFSLLLPWSIVDKKYYCVEGNPQGNLYYSIRIMKKRMGCVSKDYLQFSTCDGNPVYEHEMANLYAYLTTPVIYTPNYAITIEIVEQRGIGYLFRAVKSDYKTQIYYDPSLGWQPTASQLQHPSQLSMHHTAFVNVAGSRDSFPRRLMPPPTDYTVIPDVSALLKEDFNMTTLCEIQDDNLFAQLFMDFMHSLVYSGDSLHYDQILSLGIAVPTELVAAVFSHSMSISFEKYSPTEFATYFKGKCSAIYLENSYVSEGWKVSATEWQRAYIALYMYGLITKNDIIATISDLKNFWKIEEKSCFRIIETFRKMYLRFFSNTIKSTESFLRRGINSSQIRAMRPLPIVPIDVCNALYITTNRDIANKFVITISLPIMTPVTPTAPLPTVTTTPMAIAISALHKTYLSLDGRKIILSKGFYSATGIHSVLLNASNPQLKLGGGTSAAVDIICGPQLQVDMNALAKTKLLHDCYYTDNSGAGYTPQIQGILHSACDSRLINPSTPAHLLQAELLIAWRNVMACIARNAIDPTYIGYCLLGAGLFGCPEQVSLEAFAAASTNDAYFYGVNNLTPALTGSLVNYVDIDTCLKCSRTSVAGDGHCLLNCIVDATASDITPITKVNLDAALIKAGVSLYDPTGAKLWQAHNICAQIATDFSVNIVVHEVHAAGGNDVTFYRAPLGKPVSRQIAIILALNHFELINCRHSFVLGGVKPTLYDNISINVEEQEFKDHQLQTLPYVCKAKDTKIKTPSANNIFSHLKLAISSATSFKHKKFPGQRTKNLPRDLEVVHQDDLMAFDSSDDELEQEEVSEEVPLVVKFPPPVLAKTITQGQEGQATTSKDATLATQATHLDTTISNKAELTEETKPKHTDTTPVVNQPVLVTTEVTTERTIASIANDAKTVKATTDVTNKNVAVNNTRSVISKIPIPIKVDKVKVSNNDTKPVQAKTEVKENAAKAVVPTTAAQPVPAKTEVKDKIAVATKVANKPVIVQTEVKVESTTVEKKTDNKLEVAYTRPDDLLYLTTSNDKKRDLPVIELPLHDTGNQLNAKNVANVYLKIRPLLECQYIPPYKRILDLTAAPGKLSLDIKTLHPKTELISFAYEGKDAVKVTQQIKYTAYTKLQEIESTIKKYDDQKRTLAIFDCPYHLAKEESEWLIKLFESTSIDLVLKCNIFDPITKSTINFSNLFNATKLARTLILLKSIKASSSEVYFLLSHTSTTSYDIPRAGILSTLRSWSFDNSHVLREVVAPEIKSDYQIVQNIFRAGIIPEFIAALSKSELLPLQKIAKELEDSITIKEMIKKHTHDVSMSTAWYTGVGGCGKSNGIADFEDAIILTATERNQKELQKKCKKSTNVFTPHVGINHIVKLATKKPPALVIIDEAQECSPAIAFVCIALATKVLFYGDQNQIRNVDFDKQINERNLNLVCPKEYNNNASKRCPTDVARFAREALNINMVSLGREKRSIFKAPIKTALNSTGGYKKKFERIVDVLLAPTQATKAKYGCDYTVHEGKGLTAKTVGLIIETADDYSTLQQMNHRWLYVAASRHTDALVVYEDEFSKVYNLLNAGIASYMDIDNALVTTNETREPKINTATLTEPIIKEPFNVDFLKEEMAKVLPKKNTELDADLIVTNEVAPVQQGTLKVHPDLLAMNHIVRKGKGATANHEQYAKFYNVQDKLSTVKCAVARYGKLTRTPTFEEIHTMCLMMWQGLYSWIDKRKCPTIEVFMSKLYCGKDMFSNYTKQYLDNLQRKLNASKTMDDKTASQYLFTVAKDENILLNDKIVSNILETNYEDIDMTISYFMKHQVKYTPKKGWDSVKKEGQGISSVTKHFNIIAAALCKRVFEVCQENFDERVVITNGKAPTEFKNWFLENVKGAILSQYTTADADATQFDSSNGMQNIIFEAQGFRCVLHRFTSFEDLRFQKTRSAGKGTKLTVNDHDVDWVILVYIKCREQWTMYFVCKNGFFILRGEVKQLSGQINTLYGNSIGNCAQVGCIFTVNVLIVAMFQGDDSQIRGDVTINFENLKKLMYNGWEYKINLSDDGVGEYVNYITHQDGWFPDVLRRTAMTMSKQYRQRDTFEEAVVGIADTLSIVRSEREKVRGFEAAYTYYRAQGIEPVSKEQIKQSFGWLSSLSNASWNDWQEVQRAVAYVDVY